MVLSHPLGLVLPRAHLCTHLPDDSSCCIPDTGDLRLCKATASVSPESIHRNLTTMALPPSHEIWELERNPTRNLREEMGGPLPSLWSLKSKHGISVHTFYGNLTETKSGEVCAALALQERAKLAGKGSIPLVELGSLLCLFGEEFGEVIKSPGSRQAVWVHSNSVPLTNNVAVNKY